jgi:hypothetical protein
MPISPTYVAAGYPLCKPFACDMRPLFHINTMEKYSRFLVICTNNPYDATWSLCSAILKWCLISLVWITKASSLAWLLNL